MLRVSVLELPARWREPEAALDEVERLLSLGPTDLAILPEMSLGGYVSPRGDFDLTPFAEPIDGATIRAIAALAVRHATAIVAPLVLAEGNAVFGAAVVVGADGQPITVYRKRHPWFPERWATPGAAPHPLFQVCSHTATIAICYDGHFLEEEAAEALSQADLLVFTSAWVDDEDSCVPLLRSLARRFGISVANANWGPGVVHARPGRLVRDRRPRGRHRTRRSEEERSCGCRVSSAAVGPDAAKAMTRGSCSDGIVRADTPCVAYVRILAPTSKPSPTNHWAHIVESVGPALAPDSDR